MVANRKGLVRSNGKKSRRESGGKGTGGAGKKGDYGGVCVKRKIGKNG